MNEKPPLFIFGPTGFVGRNLLASLRGRGYAITGLVRDSRGVELVRSLGAQAAIGEILKPETYRNAIPPRSSVVYLVRMGAPERYELDRQVAETAIRVCRGAGVSRIIHLTGLLDLARRLPPYFENRYRIARIIERSGLPFTILRASIIFGEGSVSYELLKAAVVHLPVIPLPPWRNTKVQPIVIGDVIRCLIATIENPGLVNRSLDIGGPEVYTYGELLRKFAAAQGLGRKFFNIPFHAHLVAASILGPLARVRVGETAALLESLSNTSVVQGENAIPTIFGFRPTPIFHRS